jgi:hypothetical protein
MFVAWNARLRRRPSLLIGCARVPADDQLNLTRDALRRAGCARAPEDEGSERAGTKRPPLGAALAVLCRSAFWAPSPRKFCI